MHSDQLVHEIGSIIEQIYHVQATSTAPYVNIDHQIDACHIRLPEINQQLVERYKRAPSSLDAKTFLEHEASGWNQILTMGSIGPSQIDRTQPSIPAYEEDERNEREKMADGSSHVVEFDQWLDSVRDRLGTPLAQTPTNDDDHRGDMPLIDMDRYDEITDEMTQQYRSILNDVAAMERYASSGSGNDGGGGGDSGDEEQRTVRIESKLHEAQQIRQDVLLRQYSKKAFVHYFLRGGGGGTEAGGHDGDDDVDSYHRRLYRLQELRKFLKRIDRKRVRKRLESDFVELKDMLDNVDRATEYVIGLRMDDVRRLLRPLREVQRKEWNRLRDVKEQEQRKTHGRGRLSSSSTQTELRELKQKLTALQRNYRILQTAYRRAEQQQSLLGRSGTQWRQTAGRRPDASVANRTRTLSIQDNLSDFHLTILMADMEIHRWKIQQLKGEIDKQQFTLQRERELQIQRRKTARQDRTKLKTPKERAILPVIHRNIVSPVINHLDFSDISERQKQQFLSLLQRRLAPRNEEIKRHFERANSNFLFLSNNSHFMHLHPDARFWKTWYELQSAHQYAKMLQHKFRLEGMRDPLPSIIDNNKAMAVAVQSRRYDMQAWPTDFDTLADREHAQFFFDTDRLPSNHIEAQMFGSDTTSTSISGPPVNVWRNHISQFIYRRSLGSMKGMAPVFHLDQYQKRMTDNHKLSQWVNMLAIHRKLKKLIVSAFQQMYQNGRRTLLGSQHISIVKQFQEYLYALCQVSIRTDVVSFVMSQLLDEEVVQMHDVAADENNVQQIEHRASFRHANKVFDKSRLQKIQELQTRHHTYLSVAAVLGHAFVAQLYARLKRYCNQCQYDPVAFQNAILNHRRHMAHKYLYNEHYRDKFKQSMLQLALRMVSESTGHHKLRFNQRFVCLSLRQRLLQEGDAFWEAVIKQLTSQSSFTSHTHYDHAQFFNVMPNTKTGHNFDTANPDVDDYRLRLIQRAQEVFDSYVVVNPMDAISKQQGETRRIDSISSTVIRSPIATRSRDSKATTSINQDLYTISSVLVNELPEELEQRIREYIQAKHPGRFIRMLTYKDIDEFASDEVSYLTETKHTALSTRSWEVTGQQGTAQPLVEFIRAQHERAQFMDQYNATRKPEERKQLARTYIKHNNKVQFLRQMVEEKLRALH